jgi:hypothetical protein
MKLTADILLLTGLRTSGTTPPLPLVFTACTKTTLPNLFVGNYSSKAYVYNYYVFPNTDH